jgi:hypothetical protein
MIDQSELRAMLAAAFEPLEWIAAAVIDPAIKSLPSSAVRSRVEEAVAIFRHKLRSLPEVVAAAAPYATKEAAEEALRLAVNDTLDAARDAVRLCEAIGDTIDARRPSTARH